MPEDLDANVVEWLRPKTFLKIKDEMKNIFVKMGLGLDGFNSSSSAAAMADYGPRPNLFTVEETADKTGMMSQLQKKMDVLKRDLEEGAGIGKDVRAPRQKNLLSRRGW